MDDVSLVAPSNNRLEGKVTIITGGASGIGASCVQMFWQNGAKVIIADIQDDLGNAIANKLDENALYIHCDVSNEEDVRNLIDTTISKYGRLDIMFNNAGVLDRPFGSILDSEKSDLDRVLRVNVVGSFLGAKHAARVMVPCRKGCILFTASVCASIAGIATPAYALSKHGIVGLCKSLAAELGQYGIRVNCVSPSGVVTGMVSGLKAEEIEVGLDAMGNLKGKLLKAEDVAKAAMFLASDDAGYVSGLDLVVDGGLSVVNPTLMKALGLIQ